MGLVLIGFATSFKPVILAWSMAQRGEIAAAVASVVGSFTYNVTMTLSTAAVAHPLVIIEAERLHFPMVVMMASLVLVIILASSKGYLGKTAGGVLIALYPAFVAILLVIEPDQLG